MEDKEDKFYNGLTWVYNFMSKKGNGIVSLKNILDEKIDETSQFVEGMRTAFDILKTRNKGKKALRNFIENYEQIKGL